MNPADLLAISREPNVAAFLRVIRACEGTAGDNGYRMLFGGELFDSYADHPRKLIVKSGYRSTAAGAYQFLERTWDSVAKQYGLPDFTPPMQDAGAVALLIRRRALDAIRAGRLSEAVELTNQEWASLPGSPYGQPTRNMAFVRRVFAAHGGVENLSAASPPPIPPTIGVRPEPAPAPTPESKPMAPVLAALLPTLVGMIPELAKIFGSGSAVSDRNIKAAERVAQVVVAATQAPNLQGAVETMQSNPDARRAASEAVHGAWYELVEAGGGGIDGARKFNVQAAGVAAWRMPAVWVTVALLLPVYAVVGAVLWGDGWSNEIRLQVVTAVLVVISVVSAYWLGSSSGSARKTDIIAGEK